jgi:hypothetical protein
LGIKASQKDRHKKENDYDWYSEKRWCVLHYPFPPDGILRFIGLIILRMDGFATLEHIQNMK